MVYNNDMSDNKTSKSVPIKDLYLVHLDTGTLSVEATSLEEAIKLAKDMNKQLEKES